MDQAEFEKTVCRIDGYIDALSSLTQKFRAQRASARTVELDLEHIDVSLAALFSGYSSGLKAEFPDVDVPVYEFDKVIAISDWVCPLHKALETHLLPEEYKTSIAALESLKPMSDSLAWQVMEMIRWVTDDFQCERIYTANYRLSNSRSGVLFIVPVNSRCVTLSFDSEVNV